jgi:hypothetical protein
MEKERERKGKGKGEWGKLVRKGIAGAGKLVRGAAKKVGERYGMKTREKEAEGKHSRGMEKRGQNAKSARLQKGQKEGETSAERIAKTAETQRTQRGQDAQAGRTARTKGKDQPAAGAAGDSGGGSGDARSAHRAAMASKAKTRVRRAGSPHKNLRKMAYREQYSPLEDHEEYNIMSEHLTVDQSGNNDKWQSLMEQVINEKKKKGETDFR